MAPFPLKQKKLTDLNFGKYLLIVVSAIVISGLSYYLRTTYLDVDVVFSSFLRCIRMVMVYLFFCFGILIFRYRYKLKDFGIQKKNLLHTTILGIGLYTVPLLAFITHVGNEEFDSYFVEGKRNLHTLSLIFLSFLIFVMAAVTDIWTRGFVLLITAKIRSPLSAIILQNITWFLIHIYEILILIHSFGIVLSVALTIFLGVGGDLIVLKYRNVLGLAVGHIYLNLVFIIYIL